VTVTAETRRKLSCNFARVQSVFDDCLAHAQMKLSESGVSAYIEGAETICKMGRGEEPVLVFLEEMPLIASQIGEDVIAEVLEFTRKMARTPNSKAIPAFLQTLTAAARHLESRQMFSEYLQLVWQTMEQTSPIVQGMGTMYASECLPGFLNSVPFLLSQLSLGGLKNWVTYGVKGHPNDPDRQRDYFMLQSADSRAVLQRERHGTLMTDHQHKLDLYLRGLWDQEAMLVPYSLAFDHLRKPIPYLDDNGIHLPDVYDDTPNGILGINRYRALLAHVSAHQRWTTPIMADNFSPFQRLSIEVFEDARVEWLAMREYPGLGKLWRALHPVPQQVEHEEGTSYIRHRLTMLSRALLDPEHGYTHPTILKFAAQFHSLMAAGSTTTNAMVDLGVHFISESRHPGDSSAHVYFDGTEIDYRDDNRLMWRFFEDGDEEVYEERPRKTMPEDEDEEPRMPPRLYPEWDYMTQHYNPDWVSLYEHLHPSGDAAYIDQLLAKHSDLAKKLKKIIDLLKPQQKVRVRYQEEGSELDLDIALRSLIDFKSGAQPDPRINMSHKNDGRSIAVSLLLDLSASLGDVPEGCTQSKLELSQEGVSLMAWAVEQMGDSFAIGGFHSDTRHEVRYFHFKGYSERWGDEVKARLATMSAAFSTRMGAALRHAGHYLSHRQADKKLLLVLTDGEPADIDSKDPRHLIEDARIAVRELEQLGIYTYCINLDPKADAYVANIFGKRYTVIDNIQRLPERLPQLFMALTK
jgi:nitric oxide reductase NorD protein